MKKQDKSGHQGSFDQQIFESRVHDVTVEHEMEKSFLDYSMSVIVSRALPDVRDGLKPVHRRILYTLHENGLTPDKAYRKCADTVGSVLGRYHPHGDSSVYDAMVRLAQDFSLRYPLVDGHGNFGSVDGDPPAAYRYTESRMSKISLAMLTDIDKETVDYTANYDDRLKEPTVLPSRFPNLLVNGSMGIAVGMATNIPPHNLKEVIDGVVMLIDNPEATLDELMTCIPGPDFPTGGIIMGKAGIRAAYTTGRAKITLRSRAEIEDMPNGRQRIVVTEIPYAVNKARLIEHIAELVKDKRIESISDLRDESDREGMRIVIELKREANAQIALNQLYSFSQLQDTVGIIMLALHDGVPKVMSLKEMLEHYLEFQGEVVIRRTRFNLKKAEEREHILEGLKLVCDHTDEVIHIIRHSKDQPDARKNLCDRYQISEEQSSAIVAMTLGRLSGMERIKIEDELASMQEKIKELNEILSDYSKVMDIVRTELTEIRDKFADERRTEIVAVSGEVDVEELIPVEDCVITLTHYGYVKRQPMEIYKTQRRGGRGISGMTRREEDFVEELFICSTHDYILFFTSKGQCYRMKGYEIMESSRASRGTNIVNLLPLSPDEKVTSMIKVTQDEVEEANKFIVMVTNKGVIKRTPLKAFANVRKMGLRAIRLPEDDSLVWVRLTNGANQLIIATKNGRALRFEESTVRPSGRTSYGVRGIRLLEGDTVVSMARTREGACLLTVSERGKGRRTPITQYPLRGRGGMGVKNYNVEKNGLVAGVKVVDDVDDIIIITDDGIIIRIPASQISVNARGGGGVKCMRVAEGSRVVTLARAPHEDSDEEDLEPLPQDDEPDETEDILDDLEDMEDEEIEEIEDGEDDEEIEDGEDADQDDADEDTE